MKENRIALGFLVALGYEDPSLDLYETFMLFKRHPLVRKIIRGGKVVEQGARAVSTGGWYTIPELAVNGALFTGNGAALHSTPAIKGIHLAMKSGMLAAETIIDALDSGATDKHALSSYGRRLAASWAGQELMEGRNFAQALAKKGPMKWIHLAAQYVTRGKGLVDRLSCVDDATTLMPMDGDARPAGSGAQAARPDQEDPAMVDKLTGVCLSGTLHREDQPSHVIIHDQQVCVTTCYPTYGCPCTRFCPGDVYEMEPGPDGRGIKGIKLNFTNCLHCKTCDVKDPYHNVTWTCPEGGEGPNYKKA
jgi:electron-transferring-flavoprotein dehydrogenase